MSMPECWARIEWEDEMTVHTGSTDRKEGMISRLKVDEQAGRQAAVPPHGLPPILCPWGAATWVEVPGQKIVLGVGSQGCRAVPARSAGKE